MYYCYNNNSHNNPDQKEMFPLEKQLPGFVYHQTD